MRRYALPLAAALALAGTVPAFASAGLPKVATLQPGPYRASVHNDSTHLVAGRNTLTVEIPALPDRTAVTLALLSPAGQQLDVPLRSVLVLDGPASEHGDTHGAAPGPEVHGVQVPRVLLDTTTPAAQEAHGHAATAPAAPAGDDMVGMDHSSMLLTEPTDAAQHAHEGEPAPASTEAGHGYVDTAPASTTYTGRGAVSIPSAGPWQARLTIARSTGERYVAEAPVEVVDGGPSRLYVLGAGATIAGFLLYGGAQRRRSPALVKAR